MTQVETRQYDLAILIILIIFCWPAALIYYFTRPIIITQVGYPNQAYPPQPPPPYAQQTFNRYCIQCGRGVSNDARFCTNCGKQLA